MRPSTHSHPLRTIREILGKSRPQFGALLGVTQHAIKRIENGRLKVSRKLALRAMRATGANWCELVKGPKGRPIDVRGVPYSRQSYERWTHDYRTDRQQVLTVGRRRWEPVTLDLKRRRRQEIADLLHWTDILLQAADQLARLPQVKQSLIDWLTKARAEFRLTDTIDRDLRRRTFRDTVAFRVAELRACPRLARLYGFKHKGQPDNQIVAFTQTCWPVWCPGAQAPPDTTRHPPANR